MERPSVLSSFFDYISKIPCTIELVIHSMYIVKKTILLWFLSFFFSTPQLIRTR
jgi:hypothetical protein